MQIRFVLMLMLSAMIAVFAVQNGENANIDLFFAEYQISQALVVILSVFLGAFVTALVSTVGRVRKALNIKSLNKAIKSKEKTIRLLEDEKAKLENEILLLEEEKSEEHEKLLQMISKNSALEDEINRLNEKNNALIVQYKEKTADKQVD